MCRLCHTGVLGDERHMLLECPALADLRDEFYRLVADCSGVMARLVWAADDKQTLFHPFSLVGRQG